MAIKGTGKVASGIWPFGTVEEGLFLAKAHFLEEVSS